MRDWMPHTKAPDGPFGRRPGEQLAYEGASKLVPYSHVFDGVSLIPVRMRELGEAASLERTNTFRDSTKYSVPNHSERLRRRFNTSRDLRLRVDCRLYGSPGLLAGSGGGNLCNQVTSHDPIGWSGQTWVASRGLARNPPKVRSHFNRSEAFSCAYLALAIPMTRPGGRRYCQPRSHDDVHGWPGQMSTPKGSGYPRLAPSGGRR